MKKKLAILFIGIMMLLVGCSGSDPVEQVCKEQFVGRTYGDMVEEKGTPHHPLDPGMAREGYSKCAYVYTGGDLEYVINVTVKHEDDENQEKYMICENDYQARNLELDFALEEYMDKLIERCGAANEMQRNEVTREMYGMWKSENGQYSIEAFVMKGRYDATKYDVKITLKFDKYGLAGL